MSQDTNAPKRIAFVLNALTKGELKGGNYDVSAIYTLLQKPTLGECEGPAPVHECPNIGDFIIKFTNLLNGWSIRDQLIFYFSGHGEIRRGVYGLIFGPAQTDFYPFDNILNSLDSNGVSRAIIILDTCHSGAAIGDKGSSGPEGSQRGLPKGRAIIASSRASEVSQESSVGKASIFTELLCQGIESGLDGEPTRDGYITVGDIVDYITKKLESEERYAPFTQRPVFSVNASERDIWLARNISGRVADQLKEKYPSIKLVTSMEELQLLYDRTIHTEHPCPNATVADLDWDLVKFYAEALGYQVDRFPSREQLLSVIKFYSAIPYQGQEALHKSAVLCFAERPETMYPQAKSIFVIGNPRDKKSEREDFTGPLSVQVDHLVKRIIKEFTRISEFEGGGGLRSESLEIDEAVVRELVSNALVHRDYEHNSIVKITLKPDMLEIQSPGRFPKGLDWNSFLENPDTLVSAPVNGAIAHYMSRLLAFEGMGRGFDVIKEYINKNGSDSIQFKEILGPSILVRVKRRRLNVVQAGPGGIAVVNSYQPTSPVPIDTKTLAAAHKRLAEMPIDHIPNIATLPPGSRLPYAPNPHFVGREAELRELAQLLKVGQTATIGQAAAVTGLGGIGKSQLAVTFAHRYGQYFAGGVYWLSFSDPTAIAAEIAACAPPGSEGLDLETQVRRVLSDWQNDLPRLLIFDNCEDEQLLAKWCPSTGQSRVVVTSRRQLWNASLGTQVLALDTLPRENSINLLRKFRPKLTDSEVNPIAAELGDLPLALHLAGNFLARYPRVTLADYLIQLRAVNPLAHPALQGRGADYSPTGHGMHVAQTFALSYERLNPAAETDALARQLLARAACFAPGEPIPTALLLSTIEVKSRFEVETEDGPSSLITPHSSFDLDDALRRLTDLGLLTAVENETVTLHRLLAAFVQQTNPDPATQPAVEHALLAEAERLNQAGIPGPLLAWQLHLRQITDAAKQREDEIGANLCTEMGYHLQMIGDYAGALPYYERALAISEQVLGPDHPDTARSLNNLGGLLQAQGDYAGARPYYERALAIREQVLGPEHPDTARSLNNLGLLLDSLGAYEATLPYYVRALAIYEKALGPEHPDTASSLNNLGFLLARLGDYEAALPYYERALAIYEKMLGPEHPDTASSLNNLGFLLATLGDYEAARPYYERALAIREQVLGPEHPDTATSLNNLAVLCVNQNDLLTAIDYMRRAVDIQERKLGTNHPHTQSLRSSLSVILKKRQVEITNRFPLTQLHQNLATLRKREAKYAGNAPLDLLNQITDHEQAIAITEQAIAGTLAEAAWREQLRPLLVIIRDRSEQAPHTCGVAIGDVVGGVVDTVIAGGNIIVSGDIVTGVKQTATGSNIAQASYGGTATVNINQPEE